MLKQYFPLFWFGHVPTYLPTSKSFLNRNLIFYLCTGLFIQANITDLVEAFIQVIMELLITVLFVTVLLKVKTSLSQFKEVFTAFVICENFFYLCALPFAIWYIATRTSEYSLLPLYAAIIIIVWFWAIIAHLLHSLFDFKWGISILISVFYFLVTYLGSLALIIM
jgi:hypothetical protein